MKNLIALALSASLAFPSLGLSQDNPLPEAWAMCEGMSNLGVSWQELKDLGVPEMTVARSVMDSGITDGDIASFLIALVMVVYATPSQEPEMLRDAIMAACLQKFAGLPR